MEKSAIPLFPYDSRRGKSCQVIHRLGLGANRTFVLWITLFLGSPACRLSQVVNASVAHLTTLVKSSGHKSRFDNRSETCYTVGRGAPVVTYFGGRFGPWLAVLARPLVVVNASVAQPATLVKGKSRFILRSVLSA